MEVGLRPEAAPRQADRHRDGASLGRRGFSSACRAIPAQSWNASALSTSVDKHQRGLLVQRQPAAAHPLFARRRVRPARLWVCRTKPASSRAASSQLWTVTSAGSTGNGNSRSLLHCRSTSTRLDAVISSKQPNRVGQERVHRARDARRDVCEHQVAPAIRGHQPVGRRQVDSQPPSLSTDGLFQGRNLHGGPAHGSQFKKMAAGRERGCIHLHQARTVPRARVSLASSIGKTIARSLTYKETPHGR